MIALASASAICVRKICPNPLSDFRRVIAMPAVISRLPSFDFFRTPIDAVTINGRTCFGISAAFGVVDFAENEFKINLRRLFGAVRDAIQ